MSSLAVQVILSFFLVFMAILFIATWAGRYDFNTRLNLQDRIGVCSLLAMSMLWISSLLDKL